MTVVDIKTNRVKRDSRSLPLGASTSDAGRFFAKMVRDIEIDCGGRRQLTRIEGELIRAFAGAATTLRYLNVQIALGETSAIDLSGYATIASTMLRIGSKLGVSRRSSAPVPDFYQDTLPELAKQQEVSADRDQHLETDAQER
jgi:hypothetical protein